MFTNFMKPFLNVATGIDQILYRIGISDSYIAMPSRTGHVVALLFHKFTSETGGRLAVRRAWKPVSVDDFEAVILSFKKSGYQFLLPCDLLKNAHLGRKSVMITVDDGYASFLLIINVLLRHGACAALFVSAANVLRQEPFWADVLSRCATEHRWPEGKTRAAVGELRDKKTDEARAWLEAAFGVEAVQHIEPADRPLTPDELRALARMENIELGNHAFHHVTLAPRPESLMRSELERGQAAMEEMTGQRPVSIAYPNGRCDAALIAQCRDIGLRIGFLSQPGRELVGPIGPDADSLSLRRFEIRGDFDPVHQAISARMPVSAHRSLVTLGRIWRGSLAKLPPASSRRAPLTR